MQPKGRLPGPARSSRGPVAPGVAGAPLRGPMPPAGARPYGQAPKGPPRGVTNHRFLMFGLPFLILNGLLLLLVCGVLLFVFVLAGAATRGTGGSGLGNAIAGGAAIVLVVCLMFLGYVIASGILCILGKVAGWWMGMIYSGLNAALQLISLLITVSGPQGNSGVIWIVLGLLMHLGLIVAGILDFKAYKAKRRAGPGMQVPMRTGRPPAANEPGRAVGLMRGPRPMNAPAYPAQAAAQPAPQPLPMADTVLQHQPAQQMEDPAAPPAPAQSDMMTPKQAGIELLALVASCEPQLAPDRLRRASVAAAKLMGETARPEIQQWLSGPAQVYDIAAQLGHLMPYVAGNAKLAAGLMKCASYTLKDSDGTFSAIAQQVMALLESGLAAPPIDAPPVLAPPPPAVGHAAPQGGARMPSQRRRRPGYR